MEKILITGGSGYIGSKLTELLLKNFNVTVLDNLYYNQNSLLHLCKYQSFKFIYGDCRDKNCLKQVIKDKDIIIPLAALVGAPACEKNKKYATEVNLEAIESLISLSKKNQKIIYPTTNSGYGIGGHNFCTEESPLNPISHYAVTKIEAEKLLLQRNNTITLRLATVFGVSSRMRLDLLVNDFVFKAYTQKKLILYEENFRRNFIHISDVCETFLHCIQNFNKMKNQCYNVGLSSANLTKRQLAEKIKNHIPELEIISDNSGNDPDKRDYVVSNIKLENTGWKPKYSLDLGIKELIKSLEIIKNTEKSIKYTNAI